MPKLTDKQVAVLRDAQSNKGDIFQLPERRKHSPATLAALVKAGMLVKLPVGVIWSITPAGVDALNAQSAGESSKK